MGAIDLAAEAADRVTARAPDDADAWARVGRLRLRLMQRDAALAALEQRARDPARRGRAAGPRARPPSRRRRRRRGYGDASWRPRSRRTVAAAWARYAHALARTDRISDAIAASERALDAQPARRRGGRAARAPAGRGPARPARRVSTGQPAGTSGRPRSGLPRTRRTVQKSSTSGRLPSRACACGPMPRGMRLRFALLATLCAVRARRRGPCLHARHQRCRRAQPRATCSRRSTGAKYVALLHAVVGRRAPAGALDRALHHLVLADGFGQLRGRGRQGRPRRHGRTVAGPTAAATARLRRTNPADMACLHGAAGRAAEGQGRRVRDLERARQRGVLARADRRRPLHRARQGRAPGDQGRRPGRGRARRPVQRQRLRLPRPDVRGGRQGLVRRRRRSHRHARA